MKTTSMSDNTICIVDDEPGILEPLSGILADEGYRVTLAKTYMEALNVIRQEPPAVVFLDVWLPEFDGLEMLKRVCRQFPDVAVIMMDGRGSVETAVKATKLGAYDYLEKPLDLEKVAILVRKAVRNAMRYRAFKMEITKEKMDRIAEYFFLRDLEPFVRKALDQRSDWLEWGSNRISLHECRREDPFKWLKRLKFLSFGKKSWEGKYGVGIAPDKDNACELIIGVWRECDAKKKTRAPKVQPEGHLKNKLDETIGPGKDNDWWEWYHPVQGPYRLSFKSHKDEAVENIGGQLVAIINVAAPIIDEHVRPMLRG